MGSQYYPSGKSSGFQYEKQKSIQGTDSKDSVKKISKSDEDLVIEENTVYEIDRDCYERLRRQKKR